MIIYTQECLEVPSTPTNRTFDNRLSVYTLSVSPTPIRVRFYFEYSIIRLIDAITSQYSTYFGSTNGLGACTRTQLCKEVAHIWVGTIP